MTDLEKHITRMRDQLDAAEPPPGHMKRFRNKLKQQQNPVRRINFRHALQIAASIAIIAASGIWIIKTGNSGDKVAVTNESVEFRETNSYYVRQVNDRYEDIEALNFDSEDEKEMLLDELSSMDQYYRELLKELDANPGDDRVMNALIRHYKLKLQVMDQIIEQLIQLKNINTDENENTEI